MERRNQGLHGINEAFGHRPSITDSGAVNLEQVIRQLEVDNPPILINYFIVSLLMSITLL
jgi:hypothetical protein